MRERARALGVALATLVTVPILPGCGGTGETGPIEVRWDRDMCVRCSMAVSDRHYSAQVRGGPPDQKTTVSVFDDLGCSVLWLEQQPWRDDARTEVWVNEHRTGKWVDARKAGYVDGRVTPMDFGLGAVENRSEGTFGWDGAVERIRAKARARSGDREGARSTP